MNINEFAEGDLITRNEPMTYKHNGSADSSWCGHKLKLIGVDEYAKMIVLEVEDGNNYTLSYARDPWNEGWAMFPKKFLK